MADNISCIHDFINILIKIMYTTKVLTFKSMQKLVTQGRPDLLLLGFYQHVIWCMHHRIQKSGPKDL